jgi:hypothetical protein
MAVVSGGGGEDGSEGATPGEPAAERSEARRGISMGLVERASS